MDSDTSSWACLPVNWMIQTRSTRADSDIPAVPNTMCGSPITGMCLQDDFEPWPPRIIMRTDDAATGIADILPASLLAALMRTTKLGSSGLEILEFDNMEDLRLLARKLQSELGDRAPLPTAPPRPAAPIS